MSDLQKLLDLGADVVAGDVIWKQKSLGRIRDGAFYPNENGLEALQIDDVPVRMVTETAAPTPAAKKARAKKAAEPEVVQEPEAPVEPTPLNLDDLLA